MTGDARSREEIERDILDKRAALSANISQLKASLSFGSVAQQVGKVGLKHAGDLGTSALKQAKKNPLPVATIVAGIAWLLFSNSKTDTAADTEARTVSVMNDEPEPVDKTTPLGAKPVNETNMPNGVFDRHPLVLGAIALAAGAALGSLLPRSKAEDELVTSAQELMRAEADRVSNIAQTLKEEAEAIIAETKADLDSGAPSNRTAADAVGGLAKEAADRMMSAAVTAAKDTKRG